MELPENAYRLERAAHHYTARRKVQWANRGNLLLGVVLLLWGGWLVSLSLVYLPVPLLGLFLIGQGLWFWKRPSPLSVLLQGLAGLSWGLSEVLGSFFIAGATTGLPSSGGVLMGVAIMVYGVLRLLSFPETYTLFREHHSEEDLSRLQDLEARVRQANLEAATNIISFQVLGVAGGRWRMLLGKDAALVVSVSGREVLVAPCEEVSLMGAGKTLLGRKVDGCLSIRDKSLAVRLSQEDVVRFRAWKVQVGPRRALESGSMPDGIVTAEDARRPPREEGVKEDRD